MSFLGGLFGKQHGATESEIAEVQKVTGLIFPDSYRRFLTESDGFEFKRQGVKFFSLKESLKYFEGIRAFGLTETWGYFPILDNDDSNPWCICCKEPMTGYIVHVKHDDSSMVKFRELKDFIRSIEDGPEDDAYYFDELDGSFFDSKRTAQDIATARELLRTVNRLADGDREDACRFGIWLLSEDEIDEIIPLLDDEDPFVMRDASERLKAMHSSRASQALESKEKKLADFTEKSLGILAQAGIRASMESNCTIRLESSGIGLDMNVFFGMRNKPDAEKHFIERVNSFINKK